MSINEISIKLINHASIVIKSGDVSLLCDPWFMETCFSGGWGLRYLNPFAIQDSLSSTHLWISHLHSDHLHIPTLKAFAEKNQKIKTLANVSINYDFRKILLSIGFPNIIPLYERKKLDLSNNFSVIRFPLIGIDNFLLIESCGIKILNLNDCNLPDQALKSLLKKIGKIDVLMLNYNHAYKIITQTSDDLIKDGLIKRFLRIVNNCKPVWIVPFASSHYYCSPLSFEQNNSMLTINEIAKLDPRVIVANMGDEVIFNQNNEPVIKHRFPPLSPVKLTKKEEGKSIDFEVLLDSAEKYSSLLKNEFFGIVPKISPLHILVSDLGKTLVFDPTKGINQSESNRVKEPHILLHSKVLHDWFTKPFGVTSLFIGADFKVVSDDTKPLSDLIAIGFLVEKSLTIKKILKLFFTLKGWLFFWNRREQLYAILSTLNFKVGNRVPFFYKK